MKRILFSLIAVVSLMCSCSTHSPQNDNVTASAKDPDSFLVQTDSLPKVLLAGSYHFEYYNLDEHKTDKSDQVNILSAEKQQQVMELVNYLARFKPTKICVESFPAEKLLLRYKSYRKNKTALKGDEREQVAFRLMERFNLDTLYAVDAQGLGEDIDQSRDSLKIRPFFDSISNCKNPNGPDKVMSRYQTLFNYYDKFSTQNTVLDYFKYLNLDKTLKRIFGANLVNDFKAGNRNGADNLAIGWYSRNLRIFRNIQNIQAVASDRILVLFGAGHMGILNNLFECSPEYTPVNFSSL
jgi:hypothetical protein